MKKINYYEVDPGGNITAIVKGNYPSQERIKIARAILEKNKQLEQVGFWMPARSAAARGRLEMTGGEFCGNAARALTSLIAKDNKPFLLETSGMPTSINVRVSRNQSAISIPLSFFRLNKNRCTLPGITHLLYKNLQPTKRKAREILKEKRLLQNAAAGIIGYRQENSQYVIYPVVWVKTIRSLFEETACASGTAALAYMLWKKNQQTAVAIKQPSGTILGGYIRGGMLTIRGPIFSIKTASIAIPESTLK